MSDPISALSLRATHGSVQVSDTGVHGMITLRGDLASSKIRSLCKDLVGLPAPAPREVQVKGDAAVLWMSPDELLFVLPYGSVADSLARIAKVLKGQHHLAVDVSDARTMLRVDGPFAREVIAKLAPVDLYPGAFGEGQVLRSRLGQIAAAFWMSGPQTFEVICFRSVAEYAFDLLAASAAAGPVGHFPRGT
ncbi:sarcosine oxidase subunit gamma [Loktanella salsilacus]|jgi:sarcosine oxidase subunit gamma|uniref:Sarcosine oxidase subunit gamma n=1 Tax=Loktanella salsilacus TaxID=195913 RepID=A0A1I4E702_9RHOB|nr:sarcosine oxidase subunit gamma family protein [Loktanella salsilacus]MBU0780224.1 sarcosine oxidase subunit gamma [Alphaproteobacteria bacterium]MBU0861280.1 sarcosine oxidase subunit gamma [Alphaproteobacteria bacterium]MBU1834867.1 sarcosine oxidase subunit gamma [Alphaproteobacteria bacterium]UTH43244.1 sarcosine oxidase subunit gamma [Loktanella salsilacus]SFL01542.1 sarcosine oxidase subunit gamma [Loktanella salsilacus]|tara:strand:- start:393 stop:968 length:576 start_codon:yes stop_codon:yes gene_type:complete